MIVRLAGDGRPVHATEVCESVGDAVGGERSPRQVIGAGRDDDRVMRCRRVGLDDPVATVDVAARALAFLQFVKERSVRSRSRYRRHSGSSRSVRRVSASAARIGECLAIGWDKVDLEDAAVDVCWRLVRRTGVGLLRLPSTKSGKRGERLISVPSWAMKRRRLAIGSQVQPVFPDSLGGWRDPSNVRRVWREVRHEAAMDGLVSHTLRKTVASFLDDGNVSTRNISDPARPLQGQHDPRSLPRA